MATEPLTAEEIAELRKLGQGGKETALEWRAAVLAAHPFLLDEVEQSRKRQGDHITVMDIAHRHANDLKAQIQKDRALLRKIGELARSAEVSGDKDKAMAACFEIERLVEAS